MKTPKKTALALILVGWMGTSLPAFAQTPSLTASLSRDAVHVGDPVTYYLRVEAPAGARVVFTPLASPAGGVEPGAHFSTEGEGEWRYEQIVRSYEVGSREVPPVAVKVVLPGGGEQELKSAPLSFTVESLLEAGEENPEPRDIRPPVDVPRDWLPYLLGGLGAVLLAVLAWFLGRRFRRRPVGAPAALPPVPPHLAALARLEELRGEDLPGQGRIKEYYTAVSDVVRRYLEDRFGLRAPERTTEEFLLEMAASSALASAHQSLVGDFLSQADLVKFARYGPGPSEVAEVFEAAVRLIRETAPAGEGGGE